MAVAHSHKDFMTQKQCNVSHKKYCQQLRISKRNISTTAPTFLAEAVFACYSDYYEGNPQNVFIVSQWSS